MRLLRVGLVALVAAPIAVASGGSGRQECTASAATGLPAPLQARTSRGLFAIQSDGRICRISRDPLPVPEGAGWWPGTGVWMRSVDRHLVFGRGSRTLWRSHGMFTHDYEVGTATVGSELAFSYGNRRTRLYVSALNGREHVVARGEFPVGATSEGFYTRSVRGGRLVLRSGDGRLRATIARHVAAYAYEPGSHSLLFVRDDRLLRAQGARVERVAGLEELGLAATRGLQILPLGRLIGLEDMRRLVVLRADGSLFASTRVPFTTRRIEFQSGQPTAAPGGTAVALAEIRGVRAGDGSVMQRGVETVYVLRPGMRAAAPVLSARTWFNVCGHAADLAWHGGWLLYGSTGGSTAAVDTSSGRTIWLSSLVRSLPGFSADGGSYFNVSWS